nr:hypothetical protein 15 [Saccharospirillaceae bacterium]
MHDFSELHAAVMGAFGQPATYHRATGGSFACHVEVEENVEFISDVGRVVEYKARLEILNTDLQGHEPQSGDRIETATKSYAIEGPAPGESNGFTTILVGA